MEYSSKGELISQPRVPGALKHFSLNFPLVFSSSSQTEMAWHSMDFFYSCIVIQHCLKEVHMSKNKLLIHVTGSKNRKHKAIIKGEVRFHISAECLQGSEHYRSILQQLRQVHLCILPMKSIFAPHLILKSRGILKLSPFDKLNTFSPGAPPRTCAVECSSPPAVSVLQYTAAGKVTVQASLSSLPPLHPHILLHIPLI